MARRKMGPVLGFVCTLDVMGFQMEQMFTVPFLALIRAAETRHLTDYAWKENAFRQILDTCKAIINSYQTFRVELFQKIFDFAY